MSSATLLALLARQTRTAPSVDGDPGGSEEPVTEPLTLGDAGSRSADLQPDWKRVVRVGPTRAATSFAAGMEDAYTSAYASGYAYQAQGAQRTLLRGLREPFDRTVVAFDPGTYSTATPGVGVAGDGVDIVGTGAAPGDTVLTSGANRWTLAASGTIYVRNLRLVKTPENTFISNYAFHGSTVDRWTRPTTYIFDNVEFEQQWPDAARVTGWDVPEGALIVFYRCRWLGFHSEPARNFHDMTGPADIVYIDCQWESSDPPNHAGLRAWRVGCTDPAGEPIPDDYWASGQQGDLAANPHPALPVAGTRPAEQARYQPTRIGAIDGPVTLTHPTDTTVTIPPGRVYMVPCPAVPWSCIVEHVSITPVSGPGQIAVGLYSPSWGAHIVGYAKPATGTVIQSTLPWAPIVALEAEHPNLWLAIKAVDGEVTVPASSSLTGIWLPDTFPGGIHPGPSGVETAITGPAPVASLIVR